MPRARARWPEAELWREAERPGVVAGWPVLNMRVAGEVLLEALACLERVAGPDGYWPEEGWRDEDAEGVCQGQSWSETVGCPEEGGSSSMTR